MSAARTANPSMAELAKGGTFPCAITSSASTSPAALSSGMVTGVSGVAWSSIAFSASLMFSIIPPWNVNWEQPPALHQQLARNETAGPVVARMAEEGVTRRLFYDTPLVQERHLVGDTAGFKDVLRHDDSCHTQVVPHVQQQVLEQLGAVGVQAGRRLVEQEQAWLQGKGACHRQACCFAAGKRRSVLAGALCDAGLAQGGHGPLFCLGAAHSAQLQAIRHIAEDRAAEDCRVLKRQQHLTSEGKVALVLSRTRGRGAVGDGRHTWDNAVVGDGAFVGRFQQSQDAQEGRLAGSVRAEDDGDAACGDTEVDPPQDLPGAKALAHALRCDEVSRGGGHCRPPMYPRPGGTGRC